MYAITGSNYVGSWIKKADQSSLTILGALDAMNDPQRQAKVRGVDALYPFIDEVTGFNGHQEIFKNFKLYGVVDGEYNDAPGFKENYESWFYNREGVKLKDYEFTLGMITDAYERNANINELVKERIKAVGEWYLNNYLPGTWYSTLLTVPSISQASSFRAAPVGLLRDTPVDPSLLKPYAQSKTVRNNYKAVESATTGITVEDLEKWILEFTEFTGISDGNLVIYGTRGSIAKVRNTIDADVNKDVFNRTGKPSDVILGVQFVENDMIPPGKLLLLDGNMRNSLKHLVSPKPDLRGIAVVKDNGSGFDKVETIKDYVGSFWKVK